MNSKAAFGLTAGALAVGLLAGLALGGAEGGPNLVGAGPARRIGGVPVGFGRSQDGAVAAASAYAGIVPALANQPAATWDRSIRRIAAPDAVDKVATVMKPGLQSLAAAVGADAGAKSILRGAPVAYRVVSYSDSSAAIDIGESE